MGKEIISRLAAVLQVLFFPITSKPKSIKIP